MKIAPTNEALESAYSLFEMTESAFNPMHRNSEYESLEQPPNFTYLEVTYTTYGVGERVIV